MMDLRTPSRAVLLGLVPCATLLAGCPTTDEIALGQTTDAPPTQTAYLSNDSNGDGYYVVMSPGVAMGVRCWDSCTNTCDGATLTSSDAAVLSIIEVDPALTSPRFVLTSRQAGTTLLEVASACATQTYSVTVE